MNTTEYFTWAYADIVKTIDSISSYKNYSRMRLCSIKKALDFFAINTSNTDNTTIQTNEHIPGRIIKEMFDILILKEISDLIKFEKSKKKHIGGFDNEIKEVLGGDNPKNLNHQVGLYLAARIAKIPKYNIIGYDDVLIKMPSGLELAIECKQPANKENIVSNINKAMKQIAGKKLGDYALIAISLDTITGKMSSFDPEVEFQNLYREFVQANFQSNPYITGILITANLYQYEKIGNNVEFGLKSILKFMPFSSPNIGLESPHIIQIMDMIGEMRNFKE